MVKAFLVFITVIIDMRDGINYLVIQVYIFLSAEELH